MQETAKRPYRVLEDPSYKASEEQRISRRKQEARELTDEELTQNPASEIMNK